MVLTEFTVNTMSHIKTLMFVFSVFVLFIILEAADVRKIAT